MPDEQEHFTVGPPDEVTDSREKPEVDASAEVDYIGNLATDIGAEHPDNDGPIVPEEPDVLTGDFEDEDLPGDDELDALVSDVDTDDVSDTDNDEFTPIPIPDLGEGA